MSWSGIRDEVMEQSRKTQVTADGEQLLTKILKREGYQGVMYIDDENGYNSTYKWGMVVFDTYIVGLLGTLDQIQCYTQTRDTNALQAAKDALASKSLVAAKEAAEAEEALVTAKKALVTATEAVEAAEAGEALVTAKKQLEALEREVFEREVFGHVENGYIWHTNTPLLPGGLTVSEYNYNIAHETNRGSGFAGTGVYCIKDLWRVNQLEEGQSLYRIPMPTNMVLAPDPWVLEELVRHMQGQAPVVQFKRKGTTDMILPICTWKRRIPYEVGGQLSISIAKNEWTAVEISMSRDSSGGGGAASASLSRSSGASGEMSVSPSSASSSGGGGAGGASPGPAPESPWLPSPGPVFHTPQRPEPAAEPAAELPPSPDPATPDSAILFGPRNGSSHGMLSDSSSSSDSILNYDFRIGTAAPAATAEGTAAETGDEALFPKFTLLKF